MLCLSVIGGAGFLENPTLACLDRDGVDMKRSRHGSCKWIGTVVLPVSSGEMVSVPTGKTSPRNPHAPSNALAVHTAPAVCVCV